MSCTKKRNIKRFPVSFCFQLTEEEVENLRFQIGTSSLNYGGRRYLPYVFTEQGVAMASAILRSCSGGKNNEVITSSSDTYTVFLFLAFSVHSLVT